MMVNDMKWAIPLLCCLNLAAAAELTGEHTVFILPMSHGLDQFIANRLTRMHVFQVVTDPAKADTVITDQVGSGFEDRLKDLYPPPPEPKEVKEKDKDAKESTEAKDETKDAKDTADTKDAKDAPKEKTGASNGRVSFLKDTVNKADKPGSMTVSGRGRGTIFLVDVKSRQVLWSAFEKPKSSAPNELDHTAQRIVKLLKDDLAPKGK